MSIGPFLSRREPLRWLSASAAAGMVGCGGSPSGSYTYSDRDDSIRSDWSGGGVVAPTTALGLLYGDMVPGGR